MARKDPIRSYASWYRILLRLYPTPYRERFNEPMEQTFRDLLRDRQNSGRELFAFTLSMFLETTLHLITENLGSLAMKNKNVVRIALVTACLLMAPLVAMQFDTGVNWTPFDFIVAGTLLFGSGLAFELISRRTRNRAYKIAVGLAVAAALLLVWINLAVGIIGTERNRANLMYLGVLAIGAVGAAIARFKPNGMARALFATAAAQISVPFIALITSRATLIAEPPGLFGVFLLNTIFAALFASSALLFQRARTAPAN